MNYPTKKVYECIERIPRKSGIPLKKYQKYGDFPIIDQGRKFIGGYTNNLTLVYTDNLPVVVFGDHTRVLKFVDFQFAVGADGTKVLQPKDFLDAKYFYFSLMSLSIETRGYARHFRILKDQEIPLPPIAEQKKIVARVEKLLAKVKEAKRLRAEARAAAESLLSAELHKIFEEGKKKVWEERRVIDFSRTISGGTPSKSESAFWKGGIPWVSPKDMKVDYISDSRDHISKKAVDSSATSLVQANTILVVVRSGVLKHSLPIALVAAPVTFNQDIKAIIPNHTKVKAEFLFYMLKGREEMILSEGVKKGATVQSVIANYIEDLKVPLPPLTEQKKIVARLDALSAKLKKIEEYQKSAESDLDRLEQSILHQAFSGGDKVSADYR